MFCHISAYSETSGSLFLKSENPVFNGEQENESIIRVKMG